MRRVVPAFVLLLLCPVAVAQHFHHAVEVRPGQEERLSPCTKALRLPFIKPDLVKELQLVQWPVTHVTDDAQKFFNQGMTQYYGFNFEEALRNFLAAADANGPTKEMAMASWGIALASGPNINLGQGEPCRVLAQQQSARAVELATIQHVTPLERQIIEALPPRYSNPADPVAEAVTYSVAMSAAWEKSNNDPNVGALYAESMLDLRPWAVYDGCKLPALDTDRLRKVLQDAMGDGTEPKTIGAQHFWIHTVEASDNPGVALDSAKRLREWGKGSGHLSHMPSHMYLLLGDYKNAAAINKDAFDVDWNQFFTACDGGYAKYSGNNACPQLYFGHYVCHNLFFRTVALAFLGQRQEAWEAALMTRGHAERFVANEPGLQRYMAAELMTLVMNRRWDVILDDKDRQKEPPEACYSAPFKPTGCHLIRSIWHWARGMARVAKGDVALAREEYAAMAKEMAGIADPASTGPTGWGNNTAAAILVIPRSLLKAQISWADGQYEEAIARLKLAVTYEDALVYDEPPQWFPPARESLGGALLQVGDCAAAESIFDADLRRHTESGRALYGLLRALKRDGKPYAAVEQRFIKAWQDADKDYGLNESVLWPARKAGAGPIVPKPCPPMPEQ
jgi:tetratricopeptide (TPR) repeat protein